MAGLAGRSSVAVSSPDLMTRMFPLAEEAMKTLANFRPTGWLGLIQPIQR
jgi:hypothetical protein